LSGPEEASEFLNLPHPRALAFLGDAVYEIFLRQWVVEQQGMAQSKDLHAFTVMLARATTQVALLHFLQPHLTEAELEIIRQGRNVGVGSSRRAEQATHRQATGFEALLGALHIQQPERLHTLWLVAKPFLQAYWEAQSVR
jgi:ribonuclease-3 family protein